MKGETPREQWDRLQREYQEAIEAAFPNPERKGCPEVEVLRNLAARSARHEDIDEDPHWKHVVHCAPCYKAYLDFRAKRRAGEKA